MEATVPIPYVQIIDRAVSSMRRAFGDSCTFGIHALLDELWEVWQECSKPSWDGFGALPVSRETYSAAYQLLESLPFEFPKPSIGAEPDGQLVMQRMEHATARRGGGRRGRVDGSVHVEEPREFEPRTRTEQASVEFWRAINNELFVRLSCFKTKYHGL